MGGSGLLHVLYFKNIGDFKKKCGGGEAELAWSSLDATIEAPPICYSNLVFTKDGQSEESCLKQRERVCFRQDELKGCIKYKKNEDYFVL